MAKKIFATEEEINEFLRSSQAWLIAESQLLKKKKFQTDQFEGVSLNFKLKEVNDERKATLQFTEKAWIKIFALIHTYSSEVQWHGVAERLTPDTFLIKDVLIFPHEVASTTAISDQAEYEKWINNLDNDTFNALRFHGHSHVNMGVTPSNVDMIYRGNILNKFGTPSATSDFFYIFLIFNKKGDISGEVYDLQNNALYSTDEINVLADECDWLTAFIDEAKAVAKERTYSYQNSSYVGDTHLRATAAAPPYSNHSCGAYGSLKPKHGAKEETSQLSPFSDDALDSLDDEYYGGVYGLNRYYGLR